MTTLSIAPQDFWSLVAVMALIATSAGIYAILALQGRPYHAPIWEQLSLGGVTAFTVLGLVWIGMFGLTVLAAYLGLWQSIHPDTATTVPGQPTFGLGALVAALLGAPFLIWGMWLKYQTVRYQKEGHITDRINKAVEMLGAEKVVKKHLVNSAGKKVYEKAATGEPDFAKPVIVEESAPNIEVRIGAILSLERIAQDSTTHDKGRDDVRVMEILCAYVRENAKAERLTLTEPPFTIKAPRIDTQKALDVIKRRSAAQKALEAIARYRLDLRSVDFDGVDLSKGDLSGAILVRSRFEGASLEHTNLTGSQMQGCLLNYARWRGAKLRGTFLDHCTLNRPKATPGGFNEYGPMIGGIEGLSVIASDLTAMDYFGENPETIFGSRDTQLCDEMDEQRKTASSLFRSREAAERRKDLTKTAEYDAELSTNSFKHWVPFDGSDMAVGLYRAKRFTALGLTGWPIDD